MLTLLSPTQRNVLAQFLKVQIVRLPSFQNRFDDVRREECAAEYLPNTRLAVTPMCGQYFDFVVSDSWQTTSASPEAESLSGL